MEKSNKCNYCNRDVNELINLDCHHHICYKCFYKLCLFNNKTLLFNFKEEIILKCIECEDGKFKTNRKNIHQICSKINTSDFEFNKPFCLTHNKETDIFCRECKAPMCQLCFDHHKLIPFFSNHKFIQIQDYLVNSICTKHNLPLLFQCLACDIPMCEECASSDHKDHSIKYNKNFYEEKKNQLLNDLKLPFDIFDKLDKQLFNEKNIVIEALNKDCIILVDKIQSVINSLIKTKEDILNKTKRLEEETTINYEITKTIYQKIYQELKNLSSEDYININLLSKLPKVYRLPEMMEYVNKSLTEGLKEIKTTIDRLNSEKDKHIEVLIKRKNLDDLNEFKTLTGHCDSVNCLIKLKDGKLASCSDDKTIRLWDPQNDYNCVKTLTGHYGNVNCLIQLEDGKLASCSNDKTIRLWDLQNDYKCVKNLTGHDGYVNCLIQLKDGKLASYSDDNTIRLWDPQNDYKCVKTLSGHYGKVNCLIQLKDGKMASGSNDKTIRLWGPQNDYNCVKTLSGHDDYVNCLFQLKNGKLASGSDDKTIRLWDPDNDYNCVKTLSGHAGYVNCLFQLEDDLLASTSKDITLRLWDPENDYNCVKTLTGHYGNIHCLINLKDDLLAYCSNGNEKIKLIET